MEYRTLGKTGKKLSLLSLGCMRLPEDDEEAAQVVSRAVDLGINYYETSEWYCEGRSEIKVGKGIRGRRDKIYLSTKTKISPTKTPDEIRKALEGSLKKLETDYVDFYQVWDFRWEDYESVTKKGGGLDTLEKLRDEGLIRHIGMTSHETNERVIQMLDMDRLESITLSYHMLNRTVEPVIEYAGERGIGVVIMTPLAGGLLATPSEVLTQLVPGQNASPAAAALRFIMSNPHVTTVPSGMSRVSDVEENVRTWSEFTPYSSEEMATLISNLEQYKELGRKFCTGCKYCMPCPSGVNIARLFGIRNYDKVFGLKDWAIRSYRRLKPESLPENCTECGECETKCPNNIPIIAQLKEVAEMYQGVRD